MTPKQPYSKKKKDEVIAWLHSQTMLAASDILHSIGWSAIEPLKAADHWDYIQTELAKAAVKKKGGPPCT